MAHDVPVVAEDQLPVSVSLEKSPTKTVNLGFVLLATLANMVVWLAIVPLQSVVLPAQFSLLDPRNSAASFAFAATLSGVVALITQPLAGALSDITFSRFGRRRPWLVVGSVATILVMLLMANAPNIVWLTMTFTLFGLTINSVLSPLVAVVPDRVPLKQRALVSAFVSLAQALGTVVGLAAFALLFRGGIPAIYSFFAVCLFLGIGLFVLFVKDPPVSKERLPRFSLVTFLREFFHPARYADYRFVWGTRFFVVMAQLHSGVLFVLLPPGGDSLRHAVPGTDDLSGRASLPNSLNGVHLDLVTARWVFIRSHAKAKGLCRCVLCDHDSGARAARTRADLDGCAGRVSTLWHRVRHLHLRRPRACYAGHTRSI